MTSEWLATQRLVFAIVVVFLCYGALTDWMRETDHLHEVHAVALCPAYDSIRVVRHDWIPERSRVIRTDPAPKCLEVVP